MHYYCYFGAEIAHDVACKNPFRLAPMSFWQVLIIFFSTSLHFDLSRCPMIFSLASDPNQLHVQEDLIYFGGDQY